MGSLRARIVGVLLACSVIAAALAPTVAGPRSASAGGAARVVTDLATGWRFHRGDVTGAAGAAFDDHSWQAVALPHTWNGFDGEDGSAVSNKAKYFRGAGWYRAHVAIPSTVGPDGLPLRWFLQFDAAAIATDVYVDGVAVGHHDGGYTAFRFDITPFVTPGTSSVVAVRVDNNAALRIAPLDGDFTVYGGLYRMVHLIGVDAVHITLADHGGPGVVLQPSVANNDTGSVAVHTDVLDDRIADARVTVTVTIADANGTAVATTSTGVRVNAGQSAAVDTSVPMAAVHRWDGVNDPYLYTASVVVSDANGVLDEVDQQIGFRTFVVDPSTGAWLNGHPYQLHGVDIHEDWPDVGPAIGTAQVDADIAAVVDLGANAMRLTHYPHNERYTEDADAAGLALWTEIPLVGTAASTDPGFVPSTEQQLVEMIRQSQNHPSVLVWGLGNELKTVNGIDPTPLLVDLNNLAHATDPTRMTTQAVCLSNKCPAWTSTTSQAADITGANVFTGWFQGKLSSVASQLDSLHAALPGRAMGISEFGAGSSLAFHTDQPVPLQYTEEYAVTLHETYLKVTAARPWLWAVFMFSLTDHGSDRRDDGDAAGHGEGGLLTYDRNTKKDDWYVFRSWWSAAPTVRLQSARWTDRTNAATAITAISNGTSVEAFLNGASLGVKSADGTHLFRWPVSLAAGANTVSVVATAPDASTSSDSAVWRLRSTPRNSIRIDAGSASSTVDSLNRTWSADVDFTGGTAAQYNGPVSGTPDPTIAATYRIGQSHYAIPLDNGSYSVTVRLLEPTWTKANKRLFSISAQGVNQVFQLDLGKLVGVGTEYDVTFTTTVVSGALALAFQAAADQAVVSGIEVVPA